jgi:hypothetical protein
MSPVENRLSRDIGRVGGIERPDPLIRPALLVAMVPWPQPVVPFGHGSSLRIFICRPCTK